MVEADLPFGCFVASEMLTSKIEDRLFRNSDQQDIIDDECCPKRRKVKLEGGQQDAASNKIAMAIRDYGNSQTKAKVAKQRLQCMQSKDARRRKKALWQTWGKICCSKIGDALHQHISHY
jgi:hypothetical protein